MVVEIPSHHDTVFRPFVESRRRRVNRDKPLPVIMDKRQQIPLLFVGHWRRAVGVKHHRVEIVEIAAARLFRPAFGIVATAEDLLLGDELRVGPDKRDVRATLTTEVLQRCDGVTDPIMRDLRARVDVPDNQDLLLTGVRIRKVEFSRTRVFECRRREHRQHQGQ